MELGSKIKQLRLDKGLTQKQLASLINVAEITIRQYETGKRQPRIEQLEKIATALNVDTDRLIGWSRDKTIEENLNTSPIAVQMLNESMKSVKDRLNKRISEDFKELSKKINKNEYVLNFSSKDYSFEELLKILEYADLLKAARPIITVNAAHRRTDIEVTEEMLQHDDDIMNDENF